MSGAGRREDEPRTNNHQAAKEANGQPEKRSRGKRTFLERLYPYDLERGEKPFRSIGPF